MYSDGKPNQHLRSFPRLCWLSQTNTAEGCGFRVLARSFIPVYFIGREKEVH